MPMSDFHVLLIDPIHDSMLRIFEDVGWHCTIGYDWSKERITAELHRFDGAVIRSRFRFDKDLMDAGTKLQFIGRPGAGLENIDRNYAAEKNILVFNSPEGNRDAVGEQAVGMLLMLLNNLRQADQEVRDGQWNRKKNRGTEIKGKTVGIIGYGNMGGAFASRIKGFGVNILAYDKYKTDYSDAFVRESDLETLFRETDILSIHVPLTAETKHMVNTAFLEKFEHSIYLINTARGPVVDTKAVVEALNSGKLAGACLDVLEYEGTSFEALSKSELPNAFHALSESHQVVLSPHIAGWTHESNRKMSELLALKIVKHFSD